MTDLAPSGSSYEAVPGPAPALDAPAASSPASPPAVVPCRRPGHLGPLSVTQLLLCEAAVVGAVIAATRGFVPGVVAAVLAVPVLALALGRRDGRWWLEHRLVALRHRRRRSTTLDTAAGPTLAALRTLAPGLAVRDVTAPDGARVGVARDGAGWYAVVALTPAAPVHAEAAPIPVDALVGVLAEADQPGVVLQLVTHTVPAPGLEAHPSSPAGASYRQLLTAFGPVAMPAYRDTWVAVRIDARALAEALLDHTVDLDIAAALVASLGRRVATSLRRLGVACRVLDAADLLTALARSCDVESTTRTDPATQIREEWAQWHSARLAHRTYWLRSWPSAPEQLGPMLDWVATAPAALTSVSLVLGPVGGSAVPPSPSCADAPSDTPPGSPSADAEVGLRGLIRIAAPLDELAALCETVAKGVRHVGGDLFALDGEHGPGAYATAPTGGGAG